MRPRTLAIWTAIVAALLVIYLAGGRSRPSGGPSNAPWITFNRDGVRRIEIQTHQPPMTRTFERRNGIWLRVTDTALVPADTLTISNFITMVSSLESSDIASDSPAKYSLFNLEDSVALKIVLGDTSSLELLAGKHSPDGLFTYMRRQAEPAVWLVKGYELWKVNRLFN